MTGPVRLERFSSIAALPRSLWDHVASRYSAYGSYGWLLAAEKMPGALRTAYYLALNENDESVGAFAAYLVDKRVSRSYHPAWAVCGCEPPGSDSLFPAILLGGRGGYTSELMIGPEADVKERDFWELFSGEIESLMSEWGARSVWLLYAGPGTASLASGAIGGQIYELSPVSVIPVRAGDGDDWLITLRSHRRQRIRREMREFDAADYRVEISPLTASDATAFGELLANLLEKYRGTASSTAMTSYVGLQAAAMADFSIAFRCYSGTELTGFSYGFAWNSCLYMRACGFAYKKLRNAAEYFNLVYYYPLREACVRGLDQIEVGPGSYEAKLLRGARLEPRYAVGRHCGPADVWAEMNRRYMASVRADQHGISAQ